MKYYVLASLLLVAAGIVVAVWLLASPDTWPDDDEAIRIQIVTLSVGFFALAAAGVTVMMAVAEVRQVFPTQTLRAFSVSRLWISESDDAVTYQIILCNPADAPIVNASRVELRLVRSVRRLTDREWLAKRSEGPILSNPARDPFSIPPAEISAAHLVARAPQWSRTWMDAHFTIVNQCLEWNFNTELRWFPDTYLQGPEVVIIEGIPDQYRWVVTWWTERRGPIRSVIRLNSGDHSWSDITPVT